MELVSSSETSIRLHCITIQKIIDFLIVTERTRSLTYLKCLYVVTKFCLRGSIITHYSSDAVNWVSELLKLHITDLLSLLPNVDVIGRFCVLYNLKTVLIISAKMQHIIVYLDYVF